MKVENPRQFYHKHYLYLYILSKLKLTDKVLEIGPLCAEKRQYYGPILLNSACEYESIGLEDHPNLPYIYEQMDYKDFIGNYEYYDKVVALYVIQYVDAKDLFGFAYESLKPGGKFYASEGNVWKHGGKREESSTNLIRMAANGHLAGFRRWSIRFIRNGLIVNNVDQEPTGVFGVFKK